MLGNAREQVNVAQETLWCGLHQKQPAPCHSEARFIGEESACCPRRNSRFLAPQDGASGWQSLRGLSKLRR